MRAIVSACLAIVCSAGIAYAEPPAAPVRTFTGQDLFNLQYATDPQIRPDGASVAYVRVSFDVMRDRAVRSIWLVDTSTGEETPLAVGDGDHSAPRWSPDGKRLAYVSSTEGGKAQIYVHWHGGSATARITDLTEVPAELEWSPDGSSIAFLMFAPDEAAKLGETPPKPEGALWAEPLEVITNVTYRADGAGYLKPGYRHLYVVAAAGGAPRQLTFGAFNESGPISWSPDGRQLYVAGNRKDNWQRDPLNSELYEVALRDAAIRPITDRVGPDRAPAVSPDGSMIAYLGFDDRYLGYQNVRLYVMDRTSHEARSLTDGLDRTIDALAWADDGRSILASYVDHGVTKVVRVQLDGRRDVVVEGLAGEPIDRPYAGGQFSVARNGVVAFTHGTPQSLPGVAVDRKGRIVQLTHLNEGAMADKTLAAVHPLPVVSRFDKRSIDAWIVTPPGFDRARKYPLILEIHGGPFAAYGPTFSTD